VPRERTISFVVVVAAFAIILGVSIYMITGGLLPSGTPTAQAPVAPAANPMR
jgi:hypothetical protein